MGRQKRRRSQVKVSFQTKDILQKELQPTLQGNQGCKLHPEPSRPGKGARPPISYTCRSLGRASLEQCQLRHSAFCRTHSICPKMALEIREELTQFQGVLHGNIETDLKGGMHADRH